MGVLDATIVIPKSAFDAYKQFEVGINTFEEVTINVKVLREYDYKANTSANNIFQVIYNSLPGNQAEWLSTGIGVVPSSFIQEVDKNIKQSVINHTVAKFQKIYYAEQNKIEAAKRLKASEDAELAGLTTLDVIAQAELLAQSNFVKSQKELAAKNVAKVEAPKTTDSPKASNEGAARTDFSLSEKEKQDDKIYKIIMWSLIGFTILAITAGAYFAFKKN